MIHLSCYYGFCDHGDCPLFFIYNRNQNMKKIARPDEKKEQKSEKFEGKSMGAVWVDDSPTYRTIDPGHLYELSNGQKIQFIKKDGDKKVDGVTHEEVILVLMDRLYVLNEKLPCEENLIAISKLHGALKYLNLRTLIRVDQKVEGTSKPHDPAKAQEYLMTLKSNTL